MSKHIQAHKNSAAATFIRYQPLYQGQLITACLHFFHITHKHIMRAYLKYPVSVNTGFLYDFYGEMQVAERALNEGLSF